jgi:phage-related minor tail protein
MSGSRTISIRLSSEGADEVKRQLEAIGESGDRALGRLTDAAGQVQPALQSVSSVSDDLTRSLADVGFAATGLERVAGRMSSLLSIAGPTAIGIGAVGAAIGGALLAASNFNAETQALEISMRAVGRQADITAASLRSYIRELQAQGVAKDVATKAVTDMARNPAMSDATVGRAAALIPDAAVALQTNAADAARQLSDAFGGTYEGVRKLDEALNFLSSTERDAIRTMLEHGDRAGAVEKEFAALERRIRGMDAEMASPFKQAMNELDAAWQGFIDAVGNSDLVQRALKGITAEVKSLAKAMQEGSAASVADAIPGPLGALGRLVFPHTIAPELTVTACCFEVCVVL